MITEDSLYEAITSLYEERSAYISAMEQSKLSNAVDTVISLIESCAGSQK